jgi:Fe-Mn family superoxide dismutase
MHKYEAKTFTLPEVPGISAKQIEEHLKLYQGYVKHINLIYDELEELGKDETKNAHLMQELRRRLGFEFNGMRLHEYYFGDLEGGAKGIMKGSALSNALSEQFGSIETARGMFKKAVARGSGWVMLNYDPNAKCFHFNWVNFHDEGQLATLPAIVALDMWEHAYMVDYVPGDKMKYVDAYLDALNWETVAKRFDSVQ